LASALRERGLEAITLYHGLCPRRKAMAVTPSGRKHERARLDLYINKIVGDEPRLVRTRDISEGGLYLYKLLEPEAGGVDFIGLEMKLPNSEDVIWAVGQVVREEKCQETEGMAVRFVRLAETDRKIISDYIAGASGRTSCAA
jgi:hypothetical protein